MVITGSGVDPVEMAARVAKWGRDRRKSLTTIEATICKAERGEKITVTEAKRARAALRWLAGPLGIES